MNNESMSNQTRHARNVRTGVNYLLEALAENPDSYLSDSQLNAALECFNIALEMAQLEDEKRLAAALWEVSDIIQTRRDERRPGKVIPLHRDE